MSGVVFFVAKSKFLPRLQADKKFRWDYDYTEIGEKVYNYALLDAEKEVLIDNEDWTVGSSSSIYSGPESPADETQSLWEGETLASLSDIEAQR